MSRSNERRSIALHSDSLSQQVESCETLKLDASTPLILRDPVRSIVVLEGAVDLFAIEVEEGKQSGLRVPLGRCGKGEFALQLEVEGDDKLALLAVGVVGTEVALNLDLTTFEKPHISAILDRFLTGFLSDSTVNYTDEKRVVGETEYLDVYPDIAYFGAKKGIYWLVSESPLLFLDAPLDLRFAPISSKSWASSGDESGASVISTATLLDQFELREVLDNTNKVLVFTLSERLRIANEKELARLTAQRSSSNLALDSAMSDLANTITPQKPIGRSGKTDALFEAVEMIATSLGYAITKPDANAANLKHMNPLDAITTVAGMRTREVLLRDGWWQSDSGPLLGYENDSGDPVALLTDGEQYQQVNPATGETKSVTEEVADALMPNAFMIYTRLPENVGGFKGLLSIVFNFIKKDLASYFAIGILGGLLAVVTPYLTGVLLEHVIPASDKFQLGQLILGLFMVAFGSAMFEIVEEAVLLRLSGKADLHLQASVFDRLIRLPVSFFQHFSSGDLSERTMGINRIRETLTGATISAIMGMFFSLFSLGLMFFYSWKLAVVAFLLVVFGLFISGVFAVLQLREERKEIEFEGKVESFTTQMLTGISKLRVAAADTRAYARWISVFAQEKQRFVNTQKIENLQEVVFTIYPTVAMVIVNVGAVTLITNAGQSGVATGLSIGAFIAFTAAYGQLQGAMTSMIDAVTDVMSIVPVYERMKPILDTEPEDSGGDLVSIDLKGSIELSQISYRYEPDTEMVLRDLSLQIQAGEFVAIVGPSGSGKSTVLRLLLGFDKPEKGEILFDNIPSSTLNLAALRRQTGVVLQNGQLTSGSIYTNIVGTSELTFDDAEHAAEMVGLDEDIEIMPMGMHTVIMEGVNTLSGGQRQRLMVARALVRKPRMLILDEATSALDNRTQEIVTSTLGSLDCTRIVIAHRLSTIVGADKIFVMDKGQLVQSGDYDSLMEEEGPFKELAKRQLM